MGVGAGADQIGDLTRRTALDRRHQCGSVKEGFASNSIVTGLIVLAILWLALRSWRLVLAVVITLAAGLVITADLGFLFVGALNPISIAFAVLFVGLGADFAVQFILRSFAV